MKSFYLIDEQRVKKIQEPVIARKLPSKLVELFPIGCACYDVPKDAKRAEDLVMTMANDEFYRTLGYSKEEFAQKENQLYNTLMTDKEQLKETLVKAIENPEVNYSEKLATMDGKGQYHHIVCRFSHLRLEQENGVLFVELFGVESLFYDSPEIYQDLLYHADRIKRLWYLLKGQPGAVAIVDMESGNVVDMNDGMIAELGLTWEQFREYPNGIMVPIFEEDRKKYDRYVKRALKTEKRIEPLEIRLSKKGKKSCWYELSFMTYLHSPLGGNYAIMAAWNINRLKKIEEDLKIKIEQHNLLKDIYDEHIMEYDALADEFKVPNEIMVRRGYEGRKDTITGDEFLAMLHEDDIKYALDMKHAVSSPDMDSGIFECRLNLQSIGKEPKYEWFRIFYKKIFGADEKLHGILGRMVSIQRDKELTNQMEQRIRRDPMTMVLNKETVEKEIREFFESEPEGNHAILMIDVDNFKSINDNFGHMYGDEVLRTVARNINQRFRDTDLVGRIGGDEFVVCMKNTKLEPAMSAANDICTAVRRVLQAKDRDIQVSCSIGVAIYPDAGKEYADIFHKAEYAMYRAKHEGKNIVRHIEQWGPEMDAEHLKYYAQRENGFERALQTDQEFLRMSVELLADCKNLKAGMALLLERVAERYGLSGVSVYRYEGDKTHLVRSNHWSSDPENDLKPVGIMPALEVKRFLTRFDDNRRYSVADIRNNPTISEREKEIFERNKVNAFVYAEYDQAASGQGCIMFQSSKPRVWSEGEKHFFSEFTKIFAVFVVLQDKLELDSEEIDRLKNRDHLTGLMTEEAFHNAVVKRVSEGTEQETYFIVSCDIMGFSYVNENFGIEAGNRILVEFSRMIRAERGNFFVSRQFSDFFAGFMAGSTVEKTEAFLKKLEKRFSRMAQKYYPSGGLRLCIGVYEWNNSLDIPLKSALENANIARKHAKNMGFGLIVHYDEEMRRRKAEDREIMANFHQALEEGKIVTYLQPKFDMSSREIVGAEALSRWLRDGNVLPPGVFIDTLERIGYIKELDFYVLEECLKTLKSWENEGIKLVPISVNFSKRHFDERGVAEKITEFVDRYEVSREYLVIEITESVVEKRTEIVLKEIEQLRERSFKVSIDDFGSGYSSLNMLLHIPVDEVKVDRSFLEFYDEDENHAKKHMKFMKILKELLAVTDSQIICEGVETSEQAEFLADCGYTVGQGYLIDRPIPIKEFEKKYCKK